jgi:hypothetical protein
VRAKHRIERTLVSGPDALLQIPLARVVRIQVGAPGSGVCLVQLG